MSKIDFSRIRKPMGGIECPLYESSFSLVVLDMTEELSRNSCPKWPLSLVIPKEHVFFCRDVGGCRRSKKWVWGIVDLSRPHIAHLFHFAPFEVWARKGGVNNTRWGKNGSIQTTVTFEPVIQFWWTFFKNAGYWWGFQRIIVWISEDGRWPAGEASKILGKPGKWISDFPPKKPKIFIVSEVS